jgi:O-antigen ligase
MVYFIIVCVFLLFYTFFAWRYFEYAFYFLIFYFPFQIALNPPIAGFDVATGRLMILILFTAMILKRIKYYSFGNLAYNWFKGDFLGFLLLILLFWSGVSIFWSENWFWGFRKWLVFASIFPIYWIALYVFNKTNKSDTVITRSTVVIMLSSFFVAISAILQFSTQFFWKIDPVLHFWSRIFFPVFLGHNFGSAVLSHQSWFTGISGRMVMRAVGFFPDPHTLGFYIGLVFPIVLVFVSAKTMRIKKYADIFSYFNLAIIFSLLITTFLTFSRSAYLGLLISLFVFLIFGFKLLIFRKKILLTSLIILTVLFFFMPRSPISERFTSSFNTYESSNIERLSNWEEASHLIKKHPIIGVGIGNYSINIAKLRNMDYINYRLPVYAHNTYLDILAEMGIVGLLLWLGLFAYVIWIQIINLYKRANQTDVWAGIYAIGVISSLVWFLTQSLFDTPIFSPRVLPVLMVIFALGISIHKYQNSKINI